MAGAAAATGAAAAATGMASAGGADSEADATRATTEQSFSGVGSGERGKRKGKDGWHVWEPDTFQFWQG